MSLLRFIILGVSLLLSLTAQAHPEWKEANCVGVVDDKGHFIFTIKFDIPSYLIGQLPKDASIKELDAMMFTPGRLGAAAEKAQTGFGAAVSVTADGKPLLLKLVSFPSADDIVRQSSRQGEADRYPVLLNAKFATDIPAGTRTIEIRFPDTMGTVFTNLRKGMDYQVVMAVSKNEPGEFVISDEPVVAEGSGWFFSALRFLRTLLGDGFGHVIPEGWDHCLFMTAMFLGAASLRQALLRSLIFTVGHSITLTIVALGMVGTVGPWIEPVIALTIGLGAVMAYRGTATNGQMLVVPAVFGLVHGLGFAAAVSDRLKDWDNGSIVRILIGFNVGVELAQMAVIFTSAGLLWIALRGGLSETKVRRSLCLSVAVVGFGVMAWRVAGIARLV